jgi:hypothetical protein
MANTDFIDKIINKEAFQEVEQMNTLLDTLMQKFEAVATAATAADKSIGTSKGVKEFSDNTQKLTAEEKELIRLQKAIETTIAKRTLAESKLAQELAKEKILLQQVNKDNANAAKIAETQAGSLARLDAVILRLRAKQRDLNLTTEEGVKKSEQYKKAIERLNAIRKQESDVIEQQRLNIGNYQGSAKIIVDALERARQKSEQFTKQFGATSPEATAATRAFEGLQRVTENPQFLNISNKFTGTNKELRFFQQQINQLKASGAGDEVIQELTKRLATLTDELGDTRQEIKALSSDTRSFDLFAGSITFAADAMQTFAGVVQLAGANEEDVAKITADLVAIQAVANGVKGIANELTTKGTAANKVYAFTQGLVATAFDRSAASAKRFQAALGLIGLAVTVVGAVVVALSMMNKKLSEAERRQNVVNDLNKEAAKTAGEEISNLKVLYKVATDSNLAYSERKKAVDELQKQYPAYFKNINDELILQGKAVNAYNATVVAILNAAKARAIETKLAEIATKRLEIEQEQIEINKQIEKSEASIIQQRKKAISEGFDPKGIAATTGPQTQNLRLLQQELENKKELRDKNKKENDLLIQDESFLLTQITSVPQQGTGSSSSKLNSEADKKKKVLKELIEFEKKLIEENDKARTQFLNNQEQRVLDNLKRIADDEKASLTDRLTANSSFYTAQEQFIRRKAEQDKQAVLDEATAEAERILGRKLNAQRDADLILKINAATANKRFLIEQKAEEDIVNARKEGISKQEEIVNSEAGRQLSIIQKQGEDRLRQIEANEANELNALEQAFQKGKITRENYELQKLNIQNRYLNERLTAELDFAEQMLAIAKALGTDTTAIEKQIGDIKLQQARIITKGLEDESRKRIEIEQQQKQKLTELYNELKQVVFTFVDAGFERQKNAVQREKNLIEERKAAELDRINRLQIAEEQKAALTQRLDIQTENQKRILDQRQKAIEIRRAKFNRGVQAAFTTGETIKDVASLLGDAAKAKAQAAVLASNPLTAAFAPAALVNAGLITGLALLTGAVGAARVAQILGTPIPEYWTGVEDAPGGLAWLGERGKELLITPDNKAYETPGTATLAVIPKHSKVINNPEYMDMLKNESVNSTAKLKPLSEKEFMLWQQHQAAFNTEAIVSAIKNKPEAVVNVTDNGIELYRRHNASWSEYFNKRVKFRR